MNELDVVLSSRVRLARNYEDLPFDLGEKPDSAAMCGADGAGPAPGGKRPRV